ncbi:hypothetical protein VOLCADRAFT_93781 [Volvox carteri f. nagariensis]|uniref:Expansin-like EG45 domain-containing protein n=1 Tax=Volvox carteri f. nagariensis TaxID=3068 RepID=D8U315_VOLCA|nr:uncharacterized protein VOLCADRAFT_93781 [Volvox carteri f. nagariensis]EFJ45996.1 hypothetical protein VOLCADRAFT_93781 [Volvox carteri f. nagariensis]|eukprot:XP_002953074.1 hypothetical protein VOLCADRAFT_93781 [Volvox carteri f. nagariensis]
MSAPPAAPSLSLSMSRFSLTSFLARSALRYSQQPPSYENGTVRPGTGRASGHDGGDGRAAGPGTGVPPSRPQMRRFSRLSRTAAASVATTTTATIPTTISTSSAAAVSLAALVIIWLGCLTSRAAADDGDWYDGRATWYGSIAGGNINEGSCMYGALPNSLVSTGAFIVALSDQNNDFAGSCGRCYEVACKPTTFTDGYGEHIDRKDGCLDPSKSVIVTVTDSCPCDYPANAYSNRRWCCGDMYHMDLSDLAFGKLADLSLGVIGIRYRRVGCPGGFVPSPREASGDFPAGTRKSHLRRLFGR